jgi:hypothetical protein
MHSGNKLTRDGRSKSNHHKHVHSHEPLARPATASTQGTGSTAKEEPANIGIFEQIVSLAGYRQFT